MRILQGLDRGEGLDTAFQHLALDVIVNESVGPDRGPQEVEPSVGGCVNPFVTRARDGAVLQHHILREGVVAWFAVENNLALCEVEV